MNKLFSKLFLGGALFCSILCKDAIAQAIPPSAYSPSQTLNYVREWSTSSPISDPIIVPTRPIEEVKSITSFVDGLARPIQTVNWQSSPLKKDMVSATVYDALGRETLKYLPFASTPVSGSEYVDNGGFKLKPFQQQQAFMTAQYSAQGETYFYSQVDYEPSPLNRAQKSFAAGNSWVGSRGSGSEKSIQQQYLINNVNDAVRIFTIAIASGSLPATVSNYDPGQLNKTVTIDEKGKQVLEFKDKEGKVILKKVQAADNATDGHTGWLCTYYVYDDFNQLRFVIPPKATESFLSGTALAVLSDGLCFRYEYDFRHRMTVKKVPDAAEVWMVYDARDRLIMTQDGNLRTSGGGKWLVTVYDAFNRPVQSGLLTDATTSFATHQSNANLSTSYPSTSSNFELLSQNYYDDYSWVAGSGTVLSSTIDATNLTNSSYFITSYNAAPYFALSLTPNYTIKGMPTGSMTKVLGSNPAQYLFSVLFYDEKGRLIQSQSINSSGGKDITTTQYDFSGKPLRSLLQHNKGGTNPQTHTLSTKLEYDHLGRLLFARKQISSVVGGQSITIPEKTILQNTYDEIGQLKTKKIGNKPGSVTELETLNYDYNIRGWLLGMNKNFMLASTDPNYSDRYFGFELGYDKINTIATGGNFNSNQYNGNIAGTVWKSKGDGVNRKYDFAYDNVNRLLKVNFQQDNGFTGVHGIITR